MPPVTGSNTGAAPLRFGVLGAANINGGGTFAPLSFAPSSHAACLLRLDCSVLLRTHTPAPPALPAAIIAPCFTSPDDARITALAARDRERAEEHVAEHKLEGVVSAAAAFEHKLASSFLGEASNKVLRRRSSTATKSCSTAPTSTRSTCPRPTAFTTSGR